MEGSRKHESSQVDILFCGWEFQTSIQCISMSWLFPRLHIYIIFFTHATLHNPSLLVACWLLLPLLLSSQKLPHPQPVGSMPCSSAITSQNLAPIWLPHCPPESGAKTNLQTGCNKKEFIFDTNMSQNYGQGFPANLYFLEDLGTPTFPQFYPDARERSGQDCHNCE